MLAGIALSTAVAFVALTSRADAHGYLEQPKPSWKDGPNVGWITLVDNYWDIGSGGDQVGKFKTMAKEKGMSVKDVVLDMVKDKKCGNTVETGTPQPIPSDGKVKWLGNGGGGFTHTGPCEIYLDDKMVLHGDDCEDEFKGGAVGSTQTSDMPVDFSSCKGKCTLTIYWLAFQNEQWQSYVNCVPLSGSGGSTTQTQSSTEGSQTQSQGTPTTKGSSTEKDNNKTPETEQQSPSSGSKSTEQQEQNSPQAPSPDSKEKNSPQASSPENQTSSSEQKATPAPENQSPSSEQKWTQPPSSQQQWTPAPQNQAPSSQQQWTPAPQQQQQQQQQNQTPQPQQEENEKQQNQRNQTPQPQQQQNQTPQPQQQNEERSSVDFNSLNGGTGTVKPVTNLRY